MRALRKVALICLILSLLTVFSLNAEDKIVITDMAGREVEIPKRVERVVALSGTLRYIVYLQAFEKIVGIEEVEKRDIMKKLLANGRAYWIAIRDKVKDIPSIGEGGPGKIPNLEKLIAVRPDLVITFEVNNAQLIQDRTGIPVVVVKDVGIKGFEVEDITATLSFLGKILGKEERAEEINEYIEQCITDLKRRTAGSRRPSVYVGAISARGAHGITSTEANYPPLKWLNLTNVVDEIGKRGHVFIDKEKLLEWDPEYIFIDTAGLNFVNEDYLRNKEFYRRLRAVKEGKVYTLFPFNFYRTNIEVLLANAYFMGKVIYPDRFKDIDPRAKAREIFQMFLGIDVYDEIRKAYKGYGKVKFKDTGLEVQ